MYYVHKSTLLLQIFVCYFAFLSLYIVLKILQHTWVLAYVNLFIFSPWYTWCDIQNMIKTKNSNMKNRKKKFKMNFSTYKIRFFFFSWCFSSFREFLSCWQGYIFENWFFGMSELGNPFNFPKKINGTTLRLISLWILLELYAQWDERKLTKYE